MIKNLRYDIQGLRAIAVLIVVLYHLWPQKVTGGFIGVDVFFVISGFLITGHILRGLKKQKPAKFLVDFYAKRIRRLAPAALIVLLFVVGASFLLLQSRVGSFSKITTEVFASLGFFENWILAKDAVDYFANTDPTPVQHFWSLSVEEQFYIFWPLILILASVVSAIIIKNRKVKIARGGGFKVNIC
ncbi:hypothetical protein FACS1894125_4370 [Actinomycetota bacterium]|nr:hypothetical protein FACS1894125_4370 [Actinomycetota bacterium]